MTEYTPMVEAVLKDYANIPYDQGNVQNELILDETTNRFVLFAVGWENGSRVYHPTIHVDIADGMVWLQHNGTDQRIAEELVDAGIPRDKIVLGFQPPALRQYTEYGVAYEKEMA